VITVVVKGLLEENYNNKVLFIFALFDVSMIVPIDVGLKHYHTLSHRQTCYNPNLLKTYSLHSLALLVDLNQKNPRCHDDVDNH